MALDFSTAPTLPYRHQVLGVEELIKSNDPDSGRVLPNCFALFDEMGNGKTLQVIYAACELYRRGEINRILVVAPASVRVVWYDPDLGEIAKHAWRDIPIRVTEYHSKMRSWMRVPTDAAVAARWRHVDPLEFVITNYDFIRRDEKRERLERFCGPRTWLVLDESAAVKNHKAQQTKACWKLRQKCGRVVILNGTPIANNPLDMFSQMRMLNPLILSCQSFFHFRARYAVMGGYLGKAVVGWRDLEDMQKRIKPYALRRLKSDALDLPDKLPPTTLAAVLSDRTWRLYRDMRDDMVAWLDTNTLASAAQAGVKALRLSQIVSGFVGGLRTGVWQDPASLDDETVPDPTRTLSSPEDEAGPDFAGARPVGREKLDAVLDWIAERLEEDPHFKLLAWCRFRFELQRLCEAVAERFPQVSIGKIWGGQTRDERNEALQLLDPRTTPRAPVVVVGTPASGALGLNLTAAHHVIYVSHDYSLKTRLQSEDRVHRPGQVHHVSYTDVIAVGPAGQKTIDHAVIKALRQKNDLATWTASAWRSALKEEMDEED
jgi:SNF2 family DNA or RNA helicase